MGARRVSAVVLLFVMLAFVSAAGAAWTPPAGIPAPPFGINEIAGATTHYVDNTSPSATDTSNPNGTPAKPRRTIPGTLAAGSVVEIHGGPYIYDVSGSCAITANGTAAQPVFLHGVGAPVFAAPATAGSDRTLLMCGAYYVVEGIVVTGPQLNFGFSGHHGALRSSEVKNHNPGSFSNAVGGAGNNFVIYANNIHNNGDPKSPVEMDIHGVKFTAGASSVWIVDNQIHENGGDDVQIGDDCIGTPSLKCVDGFSRWPDHIYIGRNVTHGARKHGIDIKQSKDVVISQNESYGYFSPADGSADSTGVVVHFAPQRVWVLFNKIHDAEGGIRANSNGTDDGPAGSSQYIVGNLLYGITSPNFKASDGYSPSSGILGWNDQTVAVVDNTVTASDRCISLMSFSTSLQFSGNLCNGAKSPGFINTDTAHASLDYMLFSPSAQIGWGSDTNVISLSALKAAGQCAHCKEGSALLDASFRPQASSPAAGANQGHPVYTLFLNTYGLDITVDQSGLRRFPGGWTIGALEASYVIPDVSIADLAQAEGDSGTSVAFFTVTFSQPTTRPLTVSYATADGTAVAGSDYVASGGTVIFPAGSVTQRLPVTILGDRIFEADEFFTVNLTSVPGGTIVRGQATGTIVNDDSTGLSIDDVNVVEKRSGPTTAAFTVTLSPTVNQAVTVSYATADGTAKAGTDYVAASGSLTFPANTATQPVAVTVNGDGVREGIETFFVNLSNASGAPIAASQGTARVYDPGAFFSVTPCRVVDTRNPVGPRGGPALAANTSRTFLVASTCGVPVGAVAVALNITVTQATADGDLRVSPGGAPLPTASVINYRPGQTRANNAVVGLDAPGQISVRCDQATGTVQLIVDVTGYTL